MFDSVRALAVYVTDKDRARDFYSNALGFEVAVDLGPTLCFLRSKGGRIHLYLQGGMKPNQVDAATTRLGFFLQSDLSASEMVETLRQKGVRMVREEPEPVDEQTVCLQLLDPDGNVIDVCCRP